MSEFTCIFCNIVYEKINDDNWNDLKASEEFLTLYPEAKKTIQQNYYATIAMKSLKNGLQL